MGISTRPVRLTLPTRANTLVPLLPSVPTEAKASPPCPQDDGDISQGLHIVQHGGLAEKTLFRRERRPGPGFPAFTLDRGDQGGLFSADKGAPTPDHAQF